jgi:hypothetical protein
MKRILVTSILAIFSTQPVLADSCQETFVRLLIEGNGDGPVKIHVTQEMKGAPATKNYFYQAAPGHWMTQMIDPDNQPWVLTYDDVMYTSSNKGETWDKLRELDSGSNQDSAKEDLKANAATARNASCGTEDLDGVMHDVVEADFETLQAFKTENHYKYWVNPETGYIAKVIYAMKGEGFESVTTQSLEAAPDLVLPTPE